MKRTDNKIHWIVMKLSRLTTEDISIFYNRKLQKFLYRNSGFISQQPNENGHCIPEYDKKGNITNATFTGKVKGGIEITEKDFIANELEQLARFDLSYLSFEQKKIVGYYTEFLQSKKLQHKKEIQLNDFFKEDVPAETIRTIEQKFKGYKGKGMAIVIYLLETKHSLIKIDNNDRKKSSRIHFVRALTGKNTKSISGVNKYLSSVTSDLKDVNDKDKLLEKISKEMEEVVSSV